MANKAIKCGPVPIVRDWRKLPNSKLTRGERTLAFAERYLKIPEGALVGQPLKFERFQEEFVLAVLDNPHKTKRAYLSVARKNGKSAIVACILLSFLVGPEARQNTQIISGAMSREQAGLIFELAAKMIRMSDKLSPLVKIIQSSKRLVGLPMNVEFRALAADGATAHGLSVYLGLLDEVGQIRGPKSDFVEAITTSQGAHTDGIIIALSTQAPTDADMLSIWLDDAALSQDKHIVSHVYEAPADCDLMDEDAWRSANPALGTFRSESDLKEQLVRASRMPSSESGARNLLLNQRVASFATFIAPSEWRKCNGAVGDLSGMRVYGGLDLSSHLDLTALALLGIDDDGVGHVRMMFWTPERGLREREKTDKAPYTLWQKQGILNAVPSANIDYDYVAQQIEMELMDSGIKLEALAFDRWRIDLFNRACADNGISFPLVEFGQGFKDMGPALDKLEEYILNGNLRHGDNPLLNMCAINAVAVADPAGNRKLEKRKSTGRIDGIVALAMAVGAENKGDINEDGDLSDFLNDVIII